MAKSRKKDKDAAKWKKKKWYRIISPTMFNSQLLGETTVLEPSQVVGKSVTVNLMSLTGEMRNQNVNIRFRVNKMVDNQGQTEVIGYKLSPSFIKRVIRRRHSRIDGCYTLKTKDNKTVIIKPMLVTRNKASNSEVTALRTETMKSLKRMAISINYDELLKKMVFYKLQLEMRKNLNKVYPLKTFEVKKLELIEKKE